MDDRPSVPDRTMRAVVAQLDAMACERYEIGLRHATRGTMLLREWTRAEIEHAVPWLKRMNAQDHDIYVRSLGSVGLLLVDDLTEARVGQLEGDGLAPAAVVETSPSNLQAWLRVSLAPVEEGVATAAARILAERYGGDPNSADWRHFGRLAGFTNRKKQHEREGKQPYVLLRSARGRPALRGAQLLQEAEARLHAVQRAQTATPRTSTPVDHTRGAGGSPADAYRAVAEPIMRRYGSTIDYSKLDWMVCKRMARTSVTVDQAYLEEAILTGSPNMDERKAGHTDDYARRTAEKVLRDPEVIADRERLTRNVAAQKELHVPFQ